MNAAVWQPTASEKQADLNRIERVRTAVVDEEIMHVTWDLDGPKMAHWLMFRRLVDAGFLEVTDGLGHRGDAVALNMFAVSEGESGGYLQAWHMNVARNDDGTILRTNVDGVDFMMVKSIDMGAFQINVVLTHQPVQMDADVVAAFVSDLWAIHPELARVDDSLTIAMAKFKANVNAGGTGYGPWYAYKPETPAWSQKKAYGSKAFATYLIHSYVGKVDHATGLPATTYPVLDWK